MFNMDKNKTRMPERVPQLRNKNFKEVSAGYNVEMAINEANRCLGCKTPACVSACPVNVPIPQFIQKIKDNEFEEAYQIIKTVNSLPAVCGRVCPQETQCESKCVRGLKGESVAIGRLERFVADYHMKNCEEKPVKPATNGHKVAVIGSGPSGLTCAGDLAKLGYEVTIFEALHKAGGVLMYGIPEFRLPKKIVEKEIEDLVSIGVKIETNMVIGKILTLDELFDMGFEAIYLGTGAGLPAFMGIDGEGLIGVYSAKEFLTRINLLKAYDDKYDTFIVKPKNVAVVGGGNVAMDAARSAKRLGAENVYIVYRRSENEMPARKEEVHHAKEEEIIFKTLTNPVRIIGDENGKVSKLECVSMELGEPDASGRRAPVVVEGSNFTMDIDCVIMALGNTPNPLILSVTPGLEANRRGCLTVNPKTMQTSLKNIYAGGDAVTGAATVILAMGAGKQAAKSIDELLKKRK